MVIKSVKFYAIYVKLKNSYIIGNEKMSPQHRQLILHESAMRNLVLHCHRNSTKAHINHLVPRTILAWL
jgi:hypothetical protein